MSQQTNTRKLSIYRFIPSIITILATSVGLLGIRFAFDGAFENSIICIIIAAILDALDGRMARLLKATSDFGAELDSLSDLTVFGIAPAIIMYEWQLHKMDHNIGWAIVTVFVIACALRLARFNVDSNIEKPAFKAHFFQGLPTPAAALLCLYPIDLSLFLNYQIMPLLIVVWMLFIAAMMVSNIPTFSFKKIRFTRKYVALIMLLLALSIAGLLARPWLMLNVITFIYILSFPISCYYHAKWAKLDS